MSDSNFSKNKFSVPKLKLPAVRRSSQLLVIAFLILSLGGGFLGGYYGSKHQASQQPSPSAQKQIVSSEGQLINQLAKEVGPSVVSVNVTGQSAAQSNSFFGFSQTPQQQQSAGTGLIISKSGIVITNRHVVPDGTTNVSLVLSDGTELTNVSVIGRTADSNNLDVAFLKINDTKGKTLQPATLGDSSKVQVGDKVIAIGNALGQFQNTVTSGIISGYGRSVQASDTGGSSTENLSNLFQTDAAINPGNSGGPLVNANGEVIGINTAIAGDAQNIGFAIPINDIQGLVKSVLSQGKLQQPYLGVHYIPVTPAVASQYNLSVQQGAFLAPPGSGDPTTIVDGSPAAKAGLQENDIITKVDDVTLDSNNNLTSVIGKHSVGDTVTLTIIRGGKSITVRATLDAVPGQ